MSQTTDKRKRATHILVKCQRTVMPTVFCFRAALIEIAACTYQPLDFRITRRLGEFRLVPFDLFNDSTDLKTCLPLRMNISPTLTVALV